MCKVYTGLSLKNCIKDIMEGTVPIGQVKEIKTKNKAQTEAEWNQVIDCYAASYWKKNPKRAREIFNDLKKAGKITQPHLSGKKFVNNSNNHWSLN